MNTGNTDIRNKNIGNGDAGSRDTKGLRELESLDRRSLVRKMQESLPDMREALGLPLEAVSEMSGLDIEDLREAENGSRELPWRNFLTLLFIFWGSGRSREMIEEKGLFPEELRAALSVNHNAHAPARLGLRH